MACALVHVELYICLIDIHAENLVSIPHLIM